MSLKVRCTAGGANAQTVVFNSLPGQNNPDINLKLVYPSPQSEWEQGKDYDLGLVLSATQTGGTGTGSTGPKPTVINPDR